MAFCAGYTVQLVERS